MRESGEGLLSSIGHFERNNREAQRSSLPVPDHGIADIQFIVNLSAFRPSMRSI